MNPFRWLFRRRTLGIAPGWDQAPADVVAMLDRVDDDIRLRDIAVRVERELYAQAHLHAENRNTALYDLCLDLRLLFRPAAGAQQLHAAPRLTPDVLPPLPIRRPQKP